jgi:hypothetical protein
MLNNIIQNKEIFEVILMLLIAIINFYLINNSVVPKTVIIAPIMALSCKFSL